MLESRILLLEIFADIWHTSIFGILDNWFLDWFYIILLESRTLLEIFADIWHISIFAEAPPPSVARWVEGGGLADYTADEQTDICPDTTLYNAPLKYTNRIAIARLETWVHSDMCCWKKKKRSSLYFGWTIRKILIIWKSPENTIGRNMQILEKYLKFWKILRRPGKIKLRPTKIKRSSLHFGRKFRRIL